MGKNRSVGAFSLESSSGLSGTNVTLIFWHISFSGASWCLAAACWYSSSLPAFLMPCIPSPLRAREGARLLPPELEFVGGNTGQRDLQAVCSAKAELHECLCLMIMLPSPLSDQHVVGANFFLLCLPWSLELMGNVGSPPPSLPCMG